MGRENKQRTAQIRHRRAMVADLYVQGHVQTQIAEQLGISQTTVSTDLKAIQKQWVSSGVRNFDLLRERELRKLDRLEREAWQAWTRSQKPSQSATMTTIGDGQRGQQKTQKKVEDQVGDPRFLDQIQKCITARRALLGLDAPTRIAPTSPDGEEAYHSHVMAELMKLAEQAQQAEVIDTDYIAEVASKQGIRHENNEAVEGDVQDG